MTEETIATPGGAKQSRRADVTFENKKTGERKRYQVGKTTAKGEPVLREVEAMDDIERATGERPGYVPYDRRF